MHRLIAAAVAVFCVACAPEHDGRGEAELDSAGLDSATSDRGLPDSGTPDGALPDSGTPDGGPVDAAADLLPPELDSATSDRGLPDSGTPDGALPDSGTPDSATPDGRPVDAAADMLLPDQGLADGDGDGTPDVEDCAPADPTRHAGAIERCDEQDDDCDGRVDEGVPGGCPPDPCVVPFGGPCGGLPRAGTLYVDARAAAPGDGSPEAPFAALGDAFGAVQPGQRVAVGDGQYSGPLTLAQPGVVVECVSGECEITGIDSEGTTLTLAPEAVGAQIVALSVRHTDGPGRLSSSRGRAAVRMGCDDCALLHAKVWVSVGGGGIAGVSMGGRGARVAGGEVQVWMEQGSPTGIAVGGQVQTVADVNIQVWAGPGAGTARGLLVGMHAAGASARNVIRAQGNHAYGVDVVRSDWASNLDQIGPVRSAQGVAFGLYAGPSDLVLDRLLVRDVTRQNGGAVGLRLSRPATIAGLTMTGVEAGFEVDGQAPQRVSASIIDVETLARAGHLELAYVLLGSQVQPANPLPATVQRGDPWFRDPARGDFRLQPRSPAIDAGPPDAACELEPGGAARCRLDLGHLGNSASAQGGQPDPCNGQDDDRDGTVDEDLNPECVTVCGVGVATCVDGGWGCDAPAPAPEVCNGEDDDCDGRVDEGVFGLCRAENGRCARIGLSRCVAGARQCDVARVGPQRDICNRIDDDCDGRVDEALSGPCETACGEGWSTCVAGVQVCDAAPEAEACNGEDDDCDGAVDEDALNACGECGPVPAEACDGQDNDCDGMVDEGALNRCGGCAPPPGEVCNGEDDDCDGAVDEWSATPCTAGLGACEAAGVAECHAGELRCQAVPHVPEDEQCNGIDDDCDGQVDEAIGPDAPFRMEICNAEDDDCDGAADEGCDACLAGVPLRRPGGLTWAQGRPPTARPVADLCGAAELDGCGRELRGTTDIRAQCLAIEPPLRCESMSCMSDGGDWTRFAYDGFGNLVSEGEFNNPLRFKEVWHRTDRAGRRIYTRVSWDDIEQGAGADQCWIYTYDDQGRLASETQHWVQPGVSVCPQPGDAFQFHATFEYLNDQVVELRVSPRGEERRVHLRPDPACDGAHEGRGLNACGRCEPGPPEQCNGEDDDCDGQVDEGVTNACGGCGRVPGEACNGLDDDCDGAVDERPWWRCEVGMGACRRFADAACVDGVLEPCDAEPGEPTPEVCNRQDDDCDGVVDEDAPILEALQERCDGHDDDCDGQVDEDCACPDGFLRCDGARCVPLCSQCDCIADCADGSDEACGDCGPDPQCQDQCQEDIDCFQAHIRCRPTWYRGVRRLECRCDDDVRPEDCFE